MKLMLIIAFSSVLGFVILQNTSPEIFASHAKTGVAIPILKSR